MVSVPYRCLGVLAFTSSVCFAAGQDYPTRPIRLIVPFPSGASSTDILGRGLAQRLSKVLGQNVIVDNRPGAGGTLGTDIVAKAPADGYTLLVGTAGAMSVAPSVYAKLPYDPLRDFTPIARFATTPYVMAVAPNVAARSVKELVALARGKQGRMTFGSSGTGGTPHLCGELFKSMASIDMTHVPYKGGAAVTLALAGAQIDMLCTGATALKGLIDAGKVRAVGVASLQRSSLMPDVPTIAEQGLPGFEVSSWSAIVAPAKTPQWIVARLYQAIEGILASEEMKSFLVSQGSDASLLSPNEFSAYLKADIARAAKIAKAAKIQPE